MRVETERKMKRWQEQKWILDQIIKANGLAVAAEKAARMDW